MNDHLLGNLFGLPEILAQCCEAKMDHPTTLEMDQKMIPRLRHGSVQSFAVQGHLPSEKRLAEGDRDLARDCAFDIS